MLLKISIILVTICVVYGQQQPQFLPIQLLIPVSSLNQTNPIGFKPQYNYSAPIKQNIPVYGNVSSYPGWINSSQVNSTSNKYNKSNAAFINGSNWKNNGDGHLFVGEIGLYDKLLFSQTYRKEARWWTNREKIIEYPTDVKSGYLRHETITAIRVYNQFLDGNTAKATIMKGGVGYQYVKIKLQSKWNKGFQYLVQIHGH